MLRRLVCLVTLLFSFVIDAAPGPLEQLGKEIDQAASYMIIMAKLAQDPLLNPLEIHVRVDNGVAVAEGVVDTRIQYDRAVKLLARMPGIEKVDAKNLKIKDSQQPLEDFWITTKIKSKLCKDKYFRGMNLAYPEQISTKNGIVYVVGEANSLEQRLNTLDLIKSVNGVKEIRADFKLADVHSHGAITESALV